MNLTLLILKNSFKNVFLAAFAFLFILSSCVTQRKTEYLGGKRPFDRAYENNTFEEYLLKPKDEIFIQISNQDGENASNPFGSAVQSYSIDKEGKIELPLVGKLLVKDKTIPQVKEMLGELLTGIFNQPIINIRLANRFITVIGEVKSAGHYTYIQEKLSIFDALSLAGDIAEFGNRKEVVLLRHADGKTIKKVLNLERTEILTSEYYFVEPNDIIYVKPLNAKIWTRRASNITGILSVINFVLVLYNLN